MYVEYASTAREWYDGDKRLTLLSFEYSQQALLSMKVGLCCVKIAADRANRRYMCFELRPTINYHRICMLSYGFVLEFSTQMLSNANYLSQLWTAQEKKLVCWISRSSRESPMVHVVFYTENDHKYRHCIHSKRAVEIRKWTFQFNLTPSGCVLDSVSLLEWTPRLNRRTDELKQKKRTQKMLEKVNVSLG